MKPERCASMARRSFDLTEDIQPAADLQSRAEGLLRQVQDTRRPVVLTQEGRGTAVLVDIASYQSLLEELELLRDVHQGLADVEAGRVVPHDEARARLLARYE
jgi:prevent-host-death family protein